MRKLTAIAQGPTCAECLLMELAEATRDKDYLDAAQLLKRALQPYGVRLMDVADVFSDYDKKLLHKFWRMVLETTAIQFDVVESAIPLFETICTAACDRELVAQKSRAKARCHEVQVVCEALLVEVDQRPATNVLQFTLHQRSRPL